MLIDLACLGTKLQKSPGLGARAELGNRICGLRYIGIQVEPAVIIPPGVPGQYVQRLQRKQIIQAAAHLLKNLIKHPAHGENCWPGVHCHAAHHDLPHFAARCRSAVHQRDRKTLVRQQQGADQAADARAHHHHPGGAQCCGLGHGL